ncbi:beta-galactosidase-like [Pollicipes pollicipes]|uniref:beta-galactosidase-like n=1 Tax=Pollicipes pollicipes TaxID=41117 RepID=UPI00188550BB|nr:beta-galactosidase-like [Pollicipes pollicipes]
MPRGRERQSAVHAAAPAVRLALRVMWSHLLLLVALLAVLPAPGQAVQTFSASPSFAIDYATGTFVRDGVPFRYVAGTVHYFRVPRAYWADRLRRLRAMGANVVQTYVEWNSHEPEPEEYRFTGEQDLEAFVLEAQRQDLLVILRTGPYMDAERELGGLPYWLLSEDPQMALRTSDQGFLRRVDRWFGVLLPKLKPLLYENGGPIIMVQVENEYGSYKACDFVYLQHLHELLRDHLGNSTVLFTTDGNSQANLHCGKIPGVYATVDFGPGTNVTAAFATQRLFEPRGPLVNSEYYPGWLDHWGYPHSTRATDAVVHTLTEMLEAGANVNVYVAHGGTSFGFSAGADLPENYRPCPTSYDYDAPIAENGYLTDKFFAMRNASLPFVAGAAPPPPPPQPTVRAYGAVPLTASAGLLATALRTGPAPVPSDDALTFEQLRQAYGFVLYSHTVAGVHSDPVLLNVTGLRDRGYVFVNGRPAGTLSRSEDIYQMPVTVANGSRLQLLVENQGRICFGNFMNDIKGIVSPAFLGSERIMGWEHTSMPLNNTQLPKIERLLEQKPLGHPHVAPAFFTGTFDLPSDVDVDSPTDTFLRLDGWHRGVAFVNGFNLGRYWPVQGPQVTLYVPGVLLKASNRLTLLELESAPCDTAASCQVTLTDTAEVNGPTPH